MMTISELSVVFLLGGSAYGAIEMLWRGHTHWSMLLVGGLCFTLIYRIAAYSRMPRLYQYFLCAAVVTTVEFLVGLAVNRGLGLDVWDYSRQRWNLLGQICPLYSFYWLLLSVPACALARTLYAGLFRRL